MEPEPDHGGFILFYVVAFLAAYAAVFVTVLVLAHLL